MPDYYRRKVLLVGDGDCSFGLSLIRGGDVRVSDLTVSVLEDSRESWRERYGYDKYRDIIGGLEYAGARIVFGVDATNLANDTAFNGEKFDVIRWNFPHAPGKFNGFSWDGGRRLMKDFLSRSGAPALLSSSGGEVHIALLARQWGCWAMRQVLHDRDFRLVDLPGTFQLHRYPEYTPADGNHLQRPWSGAAEYVDRDETIDSRSRHVVRNGRLQFAAPAKIGPHPTIRCPPVRKNEKLVLKPRPPAQNEKVVLKPNPHSSKAILKPNPRASNTVVSKVVLKPNPRKAVLKP